MVETTYDDNEIPLLNPQSGLPQVGGLICPFNRDDSGPAGKKIHCLVWRNWEDFNDKAKDYHGEGTRFCDKQCHYGRAPESVRAKQRQIREGYKLRQIQRESFARRLFQNHKMDIPLQVRKIAPFHPGRDVGKVR